MSVHCIFYLEGRPESCQVLRTAGPRLWSEKYRCHLRNRHCTTGAFISCPIFDDVERRLEELNRQLRHAPAA